MVPQAVVDLLAEKHKPSAILLHGSRLRGDASASSDYDLTMLMKDAADVAPFVFEGMMIDLSAEHPDVPVLTAANDVPIWPLAAIYDSGSTGAALVARTKAAFDAGAPALSAAEIMNRKNIIKRYHQRLAARGGDNVLRLYYLGEMTERFIRFYFEVRQEWTRSYHLMLAHIRAEDPAYAAALDELADRYYLKAIERLYEYLFAAPLSE